VTENIRAKGIYAIRQCFVPNDFDERSKKWYSCHTLEVEEFIGWIIIV
jgi:transposase